MTDDIQPTPQQKADMELLNEILNTPSSAPTADDDEQYRSTYFDIMGDLRSISEEGEGEKPARFMPSDLLDLDNMLAQMDLGPGSGM